MSYTTAVSKYNNNIKFTVSAEFHVFWHFDVATCWLRLLYRSSSKIILQMVVRYFFNSHYSGCVVTDTRFGIRGHLFWNKFCFLTAIQKIFNLTAQWPDALEVHCFSRLTWSELHVKRSSTERRFSPLLPDFPCQSLLRNCSVFIYLRPLNCPKALVRHHVAHRRSWVRRFICDLTLNGFQSIKNKANVQQVAVSTYLPDLH
jgi:hypothetical protein